MKKQNKTIFGVLVVLLVFGVALWLQKSTVSDPVSPVGLPSRPPVASPAVQAPSVARPTQSETTSAAASPQRKFADMDVLERNAIRREIAKQDLPAIFQAMLDAERVEHDPMKQMGLQTTLAAALREKTPSPEFLGQMRAFITNSSNSSFERQLLIGALESASTAETVNLLIEVAETSSEKKIQEAAGSLAGVGDLGHGGMELSPALERVWRETSNPNLLFSAALSMAKIGTPNGIELLLAAALETNGRDKARLDAARHALPEVYLPSAVGPLAGRLANQPPTSEAAKLVVPILVKIGDAAGGGTVIDWIRGRPENVSPLIRDLIVQQTTNPVMLAAWAASIDPAVPFRSEQNREAIRAALAAYKAGHTLVP